MHVCDPPVHALLYASKGDCEVASILCSELVVASSFLYVCLGLSSSMTQKNWWANDHFELHLSLGMEACLACSSSTNPYALYTSSPEKKTLDVILTPPGTNKVIISADCSNSAAERQCLQKMPNTELHFTQVTETPLSGNLQYWFQRNVLASDTIQCKLSVKNICSYRS